MECPKSLEKDFTKTSIKLNEYNLLIKNLVKAEVYGIGKNSMNSF